MCETRSKGEDNDLCERMVIASESQKPSTISSFLKAFQFRGIVNLPLEMFGKISEEPGNLSFFEIQLDIQFREAKC
jgi:hypothetical protein